jgi:perosamine synthetase
VQHTFGIPAAIADIKALAVKHNLYVIEDLAHGFGASYRGRSVGTYGDAAILSFGRDKVISSVFGGAIVTARPDLTAALTALQIKLAPAPRWWVAQQLFHPLAFAVISPLYFSLALGKMLLLLLQKLNLLSLAVSAAEKEGKKPSFIDWHFSPWLHPLLLNQLHKLPRLITHRRQIASLYTAAFLGHPRLSPESEPSWLRFPLRVSNPKKVLLAARKKRLLLGDWYQQPVAPLNIARHQVAQYRSGSCPVAEKASRQVVNLPTHIRVSAADARRVLAFITPHESS